LPCLLPVLSGKPLDNLTVEQRNCICESFDFGYQWITRAVRDKDNNNIPGQGIRIDKFELDETGRQRKHWQ
jgi:hypothetical protein